MAMAAPSGTEGAAQELEEQIAAIDAAKEAVNATGFNDDVLAEWASKEREALGDGSTSVAQLPSETRGAAVDFLARCAERLGLPTCSFAQAVALFDVYSGRVVLDDDLVSVRLLCLTICRLVFKMTKAGGMDWHRIATWLKTDDLASSRLLGASVVADSAALEGAVLQVLRWQVHPPTAQMWLIAFCGRLDVAAAGVYRPYLEVILEQGQVLADAMLQILTVFDIPPQRLASGLLCCGMASAGLLILDVDQPSAADQASGARPQQDAGASAPEPPEAGVAWPLLEVATGARAAAVCEDAFKVLEVLRSHPRLGERTKVAP